MIRYDEKEMKYISNKHPIMKTLVEHYGKIEMGKVNDIYTSLTLHIISQILANSVSEVLIKRFIILVGEITPKDIIRVGIEKILECGISRKKAEYILELSNNEIIQIFTYLNIINARKGKKFILEKP